MRAFIAIDLPEALHEALAREQREFRAAAPQARWTRPEGIHLTLKFLGEISADRVEEVKTSLAALGPIEPFEVEVRGFGFFPNDRRPRVFWVGVQAPPSLAALADKVEASMEKLGFAREQRAFSPHLTLARFSEPRPQADLLARVAGNKDLSLGRFEVREFYLFESKLSPKGAEYRRVARFGG